MQASPTANTVLDRLKTIASQQLSDGHNVTIDNASIAVTGTFWQDTQPVSATDLDIRDLTSDSDSVLIYGSDDGGTTKRVIKTDSGGAIQVDLEVASVTVQEPLTVDTTGTSGLEVVQDTAADLNVTEVNSGDIKTAVEKIDDLQGALKSVDSDELITRVTDSFGTEINPAKEDGNLSTIATDTTSIDGKITACDTGSIAGTVTANAGTNLNTSALALESGGNLATIAGAIAGTEMQVDVVASIPAGSNNIGKIVITDGSNDATIRNLAANDALNVAIVDASGDQITSFGGGSQYNEDAVHSSGATGTIALAVRNDVLASLSGTDGDYSVLQVDADGALYVNARGRLLEQFTGIDDISNALLGAFKDENGDLALNAIAGYYFDGTTWDRIRGNSTDGLLVNLGANNDVTVSGTVTANQGGTWNINNVSGTVSLPTGASTSAKQDTIIGHVDGIEGLLTTIDSDTSSLAGTVSGSEIQVDVVASLPTGTNAIGKIGHDITGIGDGVKTVSTAGTDEVLAGSTSCKKVVIQAQTDNTGLIAVGANGVDATVATGTGILLSAGDSIELEIDNLSDIYVDSTVSGEGVRYTYFT